MIFNIAPQRCRNGDRERTTYRIEDVRALSDMNGFLNQRETCDMKWKKNDAARTGPVAVPTMARGQMMYDLVCPSSEACRILGSSDGSRS